LRCISKSLRRTVVRLTPLRFARLELGLFSKPSGFLLFTALSFLMGPALTFHLLRKSGLIHAGMGFLKITGLSQPFVEAGDL
jgi:hypothetical protein